VTGGAGFVGSHVALSFRRLYPDAEIVAFDNLQRRGSELNVPRLRERSVVFVHGDVRQPSDLDQLVGEFDVMIEASAEPSVHAGMNGSPR
jgi:CDP-paratose 2-epimerase